MCVCTCVCVCVYVVHSGEYVATHLSSTDVTDIPNTLTWLPPYYPMVYI